MKFIQRHIVNIILIILWVMVSGINIITGDIGTFEYICVLVCYLLSIIERIIYEERHRNKK